MPDPTQCIFCTSQDELTREDAWPEWTRPFTVDRTGTGREWRSSREGTRQTRKNLRGRAPRIRSRSVCKACNSGWMSRLEQATKPILEPLILFNPSSPADRRVLSAGDQEVLATWAVKTALVLNETYTSGKQVIAQSEYDYLRENGKPPPNYRIYTNGAISDFGRFHAAYPLDDTITRQRVGYGILILIGKIVFQVVRRTQDRGTLTGVDLNAYDRIWPVRGPLDWPSKFVVGPPEPPAESPDLTMALAPGGDGRWGML